MLKPLLILAILPTLAHARIGETPEQCAKRYGDLAERKGTGPLLKHTFSKGGVLTHCFFDEGKCAAIAFEVLAASHTDFQAPAASSPAFLMPQIFKLLEANKGGSEWEIHPEGSGISTYTTKDGSRRAVSSDAHVIIQTTANFEARKKLILPEAIDKDIEGF